MDGYVSQDWHCRIFPVRHNAECLPSLGKQYDKVCTGLQPVPSDTLDGGNAAVYDQQHGKCLLCGNDIGHFHHIVPRSQDLPAKRFMHQGDSCVLSSGCGGLSLILYRCLFIVTFYIYGCLKGRPFFNKANNFIFKY